MGLGFDLEYQTRLQVFEVVASTDIVHDLVWLGSSSFLPDEASPKWQEVREFKEIDVKELPLYLHMAQKYPAFDWLLKGERFE
jgi:hypothetical protein